MRTSEINRVNDAIGKFIVEMSSFENQFLIEAPDIWEPILLALGTLSNVSQFLEAVKRHAAKEDIEFLNEVLKANDMPPLDGSKLENYVNKERLIDLSKYRHLSAQQPEAENIGIN